jgi:2-methylcitrate dehydratase
MDRTTTHLADYAVATRFEALSPAAVHACKRRVIDTIACAVAALDATLCLRTRQVAQRYPGRPDAAVWGSSTRASPEMAAFANGVAVRYLDHSDTYVSKSPGHPSDVIAGLLAVAEAVGAPGGGVINAIALAYEVYCGFCDAVAAHTMGIDQATAAVLGAAAGAGRLLDLPRAAMANAIALALAPNLHLSNVRHGELSDWKGCAGPNGARNGVFAAFLAQDGFTGPSGVFDGAGGLWSILGERDWRLPDASGVRKIEQSDIKTYPVCYHGASAVEAALGLRRRAPWGDVRSVEVETYGLAVTRMAGDPSRWAPKTRETADHSLPFVVAVALMDGALTTASYAPERLGDSNVQALMQRVAVREAADLSTAYPDAAPARIRIDLASGGTETAEVRFPRGHVNNPISDAELEAKFFDLSAGTVESARSRRLLDALWRFETLETVGDTLSLIGPPPRDR